MIKLKFCAASVFKLKGKVQTCVKRRPLQVNINISWHEFGDPLSLICWCSVSQRKTEMGTYEKLTSEVKPIRRITFWDFEWIIKHLTVINQVWRWSGKSWLCRKSIRRNLSYLLQGLIFLHVFLRSIICTLRLLFKSFIRGHQRGLLGQKSGQTSQQPGGRKQPQFYYKQVHLLNNQISPHDLAQWLYFL